MQVRQAKITDVSFIEELIKSYAKDMLLLPRSRFSIIESLPMFKVVEEEGKLYGCGALHVLWEDLAEIRSLAVVIEGHGKGMGSALVQAFLHDAQEMGIRRVMALTYQTVFFEKFGFEVVHKETLPQKVWKDCINCPKLHSCDEIAMLKVIESVPPIEDPTKLPPSPIAVFPVEVLGKVSL